MSLDVMAWGQGGRESLKGRLSYHLHAAAWGCRGPHSEVICPSLALEPPLDSRQPGPLSSPFDCCGSAASPRQPLRDEGGGGLNWRHGTIQGKDDPTEKAFVWEKMSRLAFRLRRKMEMALGGSDPFSIEQPFTVEWGCSFIANNQSWCCTHRGHHAGAGGSVAAMVDTLLPQRKEQSPVNPSGLWPWALLSLTGLSTDQKHKAFSRHTGTTSLSLLSFPHPVSFPFFLFLSLSLFFLFFFLSLIFSFFLLFLKVAHHMFKTVPFISHLLPVIPSHFFLLVANGDLVCYI